MTERDYTVSIAGDRPSETASEWPEDETARFRRGLGWGLVFSALSWAAIGLLTGLALSEWIP